MNFFRVYLKRIIILIFFLVAFTVAFIFFRTNKNIDVEEATVNDCFTKVEKVVHGDSMEPMFLNEAEVILLENYYQCGYLVKKGDVVAYDYGGNDNPLIKTVKVNDQDEIEIVENKLNVNGEILKNSREEEYIFNANEMKMLKLYVKSGRIPRDSYLIFGDNINDSIDSRRFGAVSVVDFLGKFVVDN